MDSRQELSALYDTILNDGIALQECLLQGGRLNGIANLTGAWSRKILQAEQLTRALLANPANVLPAAALAQYRQRVAEITAIAVGISGRLRDARASLSRQSEQLNQARRFASDHTKVPKGSLLNSEA